MNTSFAAQLRPAVIAMLLLTVITGVLYPLFVTAVAQVVFPWQANGSFVDADGSHARNAKLAGSAQGAKLASSAQGASLASSAEGASLAGSAQGASLAGSAEGAKVAGSALIGQAFDSPRYFWSRISATSPAPYNAASSSGSNLGPTNPALIDAVKSRIAALRAVDGAETNLIPVDLVTSSASGLDPHISPAAAEWQSARVARARGLSIEAVRALVRQHTERRQLGFFGEARVNVLLLNLDLDRSPDRAPDGSPDRSTKHALSR